MSFRFGQRRSPGRRLIRLLLMSTAALALAGCMVASGGREIKVDEAVQHRVAAGMEYLQLGKPVEARQHLSRAIMLDDHSAAAHNAMALLYKYEGDQQREEFHYRKALRADKGYAPARNNYGILLYLRGDYRGAAREFERVANDSTYSGRGPAFENLGRSYLALGQKAKAMERSTAPCGWCPTLVPACWSWRRFTWTTETCGWLIAIISSTRRRPIRKRRRHSGSGFALLPPAATMTGRPATS